MTGPSELARLEQAYRVLGVLPNSSALEIRRAYRRLARTWHPDKFAHQPPQQLRATERMREINDAFDLAKHAPLRFHVGVQADIPTPTIRPAVHRSEPGPDIAEYVVRFVAGLLFGAFISFFGLFLHGSSLTLVVALPLVTVAAPVIFGEGFWYVVMKFLGSRS